MISNRGQSIGCVAERPNDTMIFGDLVDSLTAATFYLLGLQRCLSEEAPLSQVDAVRNAITQCERANNAARLLASLRRKDPS